jgi:thiosulfate dehydrogenase (quinone) large subunit
VSAVLNADNMRGTGSYIPAGWSLRRLHGAAVVRILFGVLWAIDATFKWLPGWIHGQTLGKELDPTKVPTPMLHGWIQLWHAVAGADPGMFALITAIVESVLAVALILGVFSNLAFIATALWSIGIWTSAEHMHIPYMTGQTDLGPSIGYVFGALALFYAAAGATWSVDAVIRPRLGRLAPLAGSVPGA